MALLPKVKLKSVVSFPASILDGSGIDVIKQNGSYQFNLSFDDFAPPVAGLTDPTHQNALLWNQNTGAYVLAPIALLGGAGGIPDAPVDGAVYGRRNAGWQTLSGSSWIFATNTSGVDPTGATDSTAGIAAAIAATPSGGTLCFPAGTFLISGSGAQIFTITQPINILGMGSSANVGIGTTFKLAAGVPNTRDVFHVTGITNSVPRGYTFRNFNVGIASGSGGQNVFHFDSTAGTTTGFAEVIIDNLVLPSTVSAGGNSIFLNNGSGVNGNGGTFNFTVSSCWIAGGIAFQQAGDTLRILNNIITGPKAGITLDQVGGAGQAVIMGNNITSDGGAIVIKQAIAPMIAFNEIESGATTEANNAIIDLIGNVSAGRIVCNEMQIIGGTAALIRLASSDSTYIDGNRLASAASFAVINTAAATNTAIGIGNSLSGGAAFMSDAGSGTIDPRAAWVPYNPAITFLGGSGVTASGTLAAYKKIGKTLYVRARATINYTTAPTEIKIPLPAGLLGVAGLEQVVPVYNYFNATPGIGLLTAGNNLFTIDVGLPTGSGQPIVLTGTIEVQ